MKRQLAISIAQSLRSYSQGEERADAIAARLWPRFAAVTGATDADRPHLRDALAGLCCQDEGRMEAALRRLSMPALEVVMELGENWSEDRVFEEGRKGQ